MPASSQQGLLGRERVESGVGAVHRGVVAAVVQIPFRLEDSLRLAAVGEPLVLLRVGVAIGKGTERVEVGLRAAALAEETTASRPSSTGNKFSHCILLYE